LILVDRSKALDMPATLLLRHCTEEGDTDRKKIHLRMPLDTCGFFTTSSYHRVNKGISLQGGMAAPRDQTSASALHYSLDHPPFESAQNTSKCLHQGVPSPQSQF
jgi:hypothetical protein